MAFKLISLLAVACILIQTNGESIVKPVNDERVAALYVKDGSNGELRFLGGSGFGTSGNINAQLNQYITQQQDLLEQLRPATGTTTGTGTGTSLTGFGTGSSSSSSVTPIVINAGGTNAANTNTANSVVSNANIAAILPAVIAQAVVRRQSPNNNRRRIVNQRRRPNRGGNRNRPNVYVVRPQG